VRLNVGRTHNVTDKLICSRIIYIPALYSEVPDLRHRPKGQLSGGLPWFFLLLLWKAESVLQIYYHPHLCTSFLINYLIFTLANGSADSELLILSINELLLL